MDKATNKRLMEIAESILCQTEWTCPLFADVTRGIIHKSYNGQVAALGVSILTIGLKPALAVYYQDGSNGNKPYRRAVLEVIARMLGRENAEAMVREVMGQQSENLKTQIVDCSVALKQVIRTYKME